MSCAYRSATGWIGAIRIYGRCVDPKVGRWPTSAPWAPQGRLSSRPPGRIMKAAGRSTRQEDPRLRTLLPRLLVRGGQVQDTDLPRGRSNPGGDLLSATGQRQHLRD